MQVMRSKWQAWLMDPSRRLGVGMSVILLFVLLAYLWNNLLPMINLQAELWESPVIMPLIRPIGTDFREGYFYPAKIVLQGKSPYVDYNLIYPPFSAVFSIPFRLFPVDQAYLVQVVLLYAVNALTLIFSLLIAKEVFARVKEIKDGTGQTVAVGLFALLAFLLYSSYGFQFSIERGNADIYVQFLVVLAVWRMVKKPQSLWLPVILIAMATHLKVYPAIMFVLVLWRFKWKSLLPLVVTNLALGLVLGPVRLWQYLQRLFVYMQQPNLIPANHSAASFANMVNNFLVERAGVILPSVLFYLLPLIIWGAGMYVLWMRGYSAENALYLFALSAALMELIPSVSYDYKLVILFAPLAILLFRLLVDFIRRGRLLELAEIAGLMFLMLFMTRSYTMLPAVLTNKYPFILAMQAITLLVLLTAKGTPSQVPAAEATEPALPGQAA